MAVRHLLPLLLTAVLLNAASSSSLPRTGDYENVALLDGGFELFWSVNSSAETIHMAARAKTKGWLAVGLSEAGSMIGSDAMVGWVSDGVVYATDRFIFNKSMDASGVALDAQQDWRLLGGHEEVNQSSGDTWTTIHFWRELNTGDCNDRPIGPAGAYSYVMWAMGTNDNLSFHLSSNRGMASLMLVPPPGPSVLAPPAPSSPSSSAASAVSKSLGLRRAGGAAGNIAAPSSATAGHQFFNLTFDRYNVPTNYTTYRCKVFDIPLATTSHVVEFGGAINTSYLPVLHHAVIFGCLQKNLPDLPAEREFDCLHQMPCARQTIGFWGVGGRPFVLPVQAGLPIGPDLFKKYVIQMHYTNPEGLSDIVDSSGIYFKVANQRRKHDAGFILTGPVIHQLQIKIPPKQPSWTQVSTCPGVCTRSVFNHSVNIIASFLHLHTAGRQMYSDIYRNREKIATLNRQDYYDFNAQQVLPVSPSFELFPNDEIRTTCVWDTTNRTEVTPGGEGSDHEMCVDYIIYYPAYSDRKMSLCTDVCASIAGGKISFEPDAPNLMQLFFCGEGKLDSDSVKPSLSKCSVNFGEDKPLEVMHGCTAELQNSISDFPLEAISVPVTPDQEISSDTSTPTGKAAALSSLPSALASLVPLLLLASSLL